MRRFVFSLESVLRLRQHEEERALERLAAAAADHTEMTQRLSAIEQKISQTFERPAVTVDAALARERFLDRLDSQRRQQQQAVDQALDVMLVAQHHAQQAQAGRKAIDKLRERRLAEWQQEYNRDEDRTLNEVALSRAGRR
jgi:flagellar FliJ protein